MRINYSLLPVLSETGGVAFLIRGITLFQRYEGLADVPGTDRGSAPSITLVARISQGGLGLRRIDSADIPDTPHVVIAMMLRSSRSSGA